VQYPHRDRASVYREWHPSSRAGSLPLRDEFYIFLPPADLTRFDFDAFPHRQLFELRQQSVLRNARAEASTSSPRVESTIPHPAPTPAPLLTPSYDSTTSPRFPEPEPPLSTFAQLDRSSLLFDFEHSSADDLQVAEKLNIIIPDDSDARIGSRNSGSSEDGARLSNSQYGGGPTELGALYPLLSLLQSQDSFVPTLPGHFHVL
jgi:hypothetical protein